MDSLGVQIYDCKIIDESLEQDRAHQQMKKKQTPGEVQLSQNQKPSFINLERAHQNEIQSKILESKSENLLQNTSSKKRRPMIGRLTYENDSDVKKTSRMKNTQSSIEKERPIYPHRNLESSREGSRGSSRKSSTSGYKKSCTNAAEIIKSIKREVQQENMQNRGIHLHRGGNNVHPPRYNSNNSQESRSKEGLKGSNRQKKQNNQNLNQNRLMNIIRTSQISNMGLSDEYIVRLNKGETENKNQYNSNVKKSFQVNKVSKDLVDLSTIDDFRQSMCHVNSYQVNNLQGEMPTSMEHSKESNLKSGKTYDYSIMPSDTTPTPFSRKELRARKNGEGDSQFYLPTPNHRQETSSGYTSLEFLTPTPLSLSRQLQYKQTERLENQENINSNRQERNGGNNHHLGKNKIKEHKNADDFLNESWIEKMEQYESGEMGELEDIQINFLVKSNDITYGSNHLHDDHDRKVDLQQTGKFTQRESRSRVPLLNLPLNHNRIHSNSGSIDASFIHHNISDNGSVVSPERGEHQFSQYEFNYPSKLSKNSKYGLASSHAFSLNHTHTKSRQSRLSRRSNSSYVGQEEARDLIMSSRTSKFEIKQPLQNQDMIYRKSQSSYKISFFSMLKDLRRYNSGAKRVYLSKAIDRYVDKKEYKIKILNQCSSKEMLNSCADHIPVKQSFFSRRVSYDLKKIWRFFTDSSRHSMKFKKPHHLESQYQSLHGAVRFQTISKFDFQSFNNKVLGIGKFSNNSYNKVRRNYLYKKAGNFSFGVRINSKKVRKELSILNNRSRKVILKVTKLPFQAKNIKATFMHNEDVRLRIRENELPLGARPCLFFLNKPERHIHYFDLIRRKHANVFNPILSCETSKINCFEMKSTYSYVVSENRRLSILDLRDFTTFDELFLGFDILSVYCLGLTKCLIVPREHGFLLFYDIQMGQMVRLELQNKDSQDLFSTGGSSRSIKRYNGDMKMNLGCFVIGRMERLFLIDSKYKVLEVNLKLEEMKI